MQEIAEHEMSGTGDKRGRKTDGWTWTGTDSDYECKGRIDEFLTGGIAIMHGS